MASRLKVAVAGATGEVGQSIMDALLSNSEQFVRHKLLLYSCNKSNMLARIMARRSNQDSQEVFALVRPESVNKPVLSAFSARGAIIKSVDLTESTTSS